MENKDYKMIMIILICLAVVTIGGSFAYFYAVVTGTGNTTNNTTSTTAISLGTINYDGTLTFTGSDIYPGYYGIQTFTISPGSQNGIGTYQIDLNSTLPTEFGTDVEITLYKTTDSTNNYLTRTVGTLTKEGDNYYQEDTLTTTGTLTIVYSGTLTNNSQIILSEEDFTIPGLSTTTYYLVYHYKNNGNQNTQEGKVFSGKVTVNLLTPGERTPVPATDSIVALKTGGDTTLEYDGTTDNNLRYIGSNPNNYVSFNGELWRIIGVMNNIDNGSGTKETRLKIIRNESIGSYSWDSSESTVNGGFGVNEWSGADLMTELNSGPYWNRTSGTCYNSNNNGTTACDFSSIGLTSASQLMIGNALWDTGSNGTNDYTQTATGLASNFYTYERSSDNGKICTSGTYCNDTVSRTTTWVGKIGLMYPSDYGYATSGGSTTNRASCLAEYLYNWDSSSYSDCKTNDWLYNSSLYQWTIMPGADSSYATYVFGVYDDGLGYGAAINAADVRPVGYLDSKTQILSGTGTSSDPYILSA